LHNNVDVYNTLNNKKKKIENAEQISIVA